MLRWVGVLGAIVALAAPLPAEPQVQTPLPRVGFLGNPWPPEEHHGPVVIITAFRAGLAKNDLREGDNVAVDYRWARGDMNALPRLARELVALRDNVLFVAGAQGLDAAKQATLTSPVPIVAVTCDPLEQFVISLARPGGNATGTTCMSADIAGKRLALLKEIIPDLARVAVLYNPLDPNKLVEMKGLAVPAERLKLAIVPFEVRTGEGLTAAFDAIAAAGIGAVLILDDTVTTTFSAVAARLAAERRLPAMFGFREFADNGGLIAYGANLGERAERAVAFVAKILKGAKPEDLPVEQPTRFELVINLKTAKAIGVTIPTTLLATADRVIE